MKQSSESDVVNLEDFNLDDFDFGDPMFDSPDPSKDRSPVTDFTKGALKGVKTTVSDPSLYINTMREALPDDYGTAYDSVVDIKDKGLGLYNEVVQELRPGIRDLKVVGRRAKSAIDGMLPDSLSKKLDGWLKDKELSNSGSRTATREELRESSISNELGELFKIQAEDKREERTEGLIKDTIENKRFSTTTEQIDGVRRSLGSLVGYQDNVTAKYQRKSLELQYRSYYAQRDLLEINKASSIDVATLLKNIQKNTSLPETEKVRLSETATQLTKERLIGKVQDKLAPSMRDFTSNFAEKLGGRLKERASEFKDAIATFAMGAEQSEMMEEFGESGSGMAGELAGDSMTRYLGELVGKRLRPYLANNDKIAAGGTSAAYYAENGHNLLKDYLENNTSSNGIIQMIQEAALDASRIRRESKVGFDDISKANDTVGFSNQAHKSLVEIIPGWLARIYQVGREALGYREGLMTYDQGTNEYRSVSDVARDITNKAMTEDSFETSRSYTKKISSNVLDDDDDEELKNKVETMFLRMARDKGYLNTAQIGDLDNLRNNGFTAEEARLFREKAHSKLGIGSDGKIDELDKESSKLRLDISRDLERLRDAAPKPYEILNMYANTGNREAVRLSGLTTNRNGEDHVDDEAFLNRFNKRLRGVADENPASEDYSSGPMANVSNRYRNAGTSNNQVSNETIQANTQVIEEVSAILKEIKAQNSSSPELEAYKSIEQSIADASSKEEVNRATEVLTEILEVLKAGINTYGSPAPEDDRSTFTRFKDRVRDDSLWGDIRSLGGRGRKFASDGFSRAKTATGKLWSALDAPRRRGMQALRVGTGKLGDIAGKVKDNVMALRDQDLFLPGKLDIPIITKRGLEAGEYYDAITGKVINHVRDITGAVKDAEGNIILTAKEFSDGLMDKAGEKLKLAKGLLNSAVKSTMGLASWAKDSAIGAMGLPGQIASKVLNVAGKVVDYIPDAYLPENLESPVLLRSVLKRGGYYNSDGSVINHFKDINSDVKDVNGNTVLELKDLSRVVDRKGKPIRSLIDKGMNLLKGVKDKAIGGVKWGYNQLSKVPALATTALGKGKDLLRYGLSGKGSAGSGGGGNEEVLDSIYDLLLKYFRYKGMKMPLGSAKRKATPQFKPSGPSVKDKLSSVKAGISTAASDALGKSKEYVSKASKAGSGGVKATLAKLLGISPSEAEDRLDEASGGKRSISEMARDKVESLKGRTNSWRDIMAKRKAAKDGKVPAGTGPLKPKAKGGSGMLGTIIGLLGSAVGALGSIFTVGKSIAGGVSSLIGLSKAASFMGGAPDVAGGGKKGGWLSKVWKGAKWAGKAALTVGGVGLSAAGTVGSALATGASAVATGVGAVLSAPVLIGAAVVAGIGVAGYFTYKYFSNKLTPMQKLRMSQYGVNIDSNKEACVKVAELETLLKPYANITPDGKGTLTGRVDWAKILKIFNIDPKDQNRMASFNDWFQRRFKPVYFTHLALMKRFGKGSDLMEADTAVPDSKKWAYAQASLIKSDGVSPVYMVGATPFEDQGIETGTSVIDEVMEEFEDDYADIKSEEKSQTTASKVTKGPKSKSKPKESDSVSVTADSDKALATVDRMQVRIDRLEAKGSLTPSERRVLKSLKNAQKLAVNQAAKVASNETVGKSLDGKTGLGYGKPQEVHVGKDQGSDLDVLDNLPKVTATGQRDSVSKLLNAVAGQVGVDPVLLSKLAMQASGYNAGKKDGSRKGMFQLDAATWTRLLQRYGDKYGLESNHPITDIRAESLMAAEYLKGNLNSLGDEVSDSSIKLAHYLGTDKAKVISNLDKSELAKSVLDPFDVRRFNVLDTTTVGEFIDSLGKAKVEAVADKYVSKSVGNAPVPDNVVSIRKNVQVARTKPMEEITANEKQTKREELKGIRRNILDSNATRKSAEVTEQVAELLNSSLLVQSDSNTVLRNMEIHLRNLSKQLLEGADNVKDLEPVPKPTEAPVARPTMKSRIPSKRSAM